MNRSTRVPTPIEAPAEGRAAPCADPPRGRWSELWNVGVRWPLSAAWRHGSARLGWRRFARSADRVCLEDVILAHYAARPRPQRMLFVGTRAGTWDYAARMAGHTWLTLDIDPRAAAFGSPDGHFTACASRADACVAPGSLDVVVFNGVFGWGLDARADVERAIAGFATVLRPGGELLVGWNDVAPRRPYPFGETAALAAFERTIFEPLGEAVVVMPGPARHRFEFFRSRTARTPAPTLG